MRTSCGLPFNASYACTNMHRVPNFSFSCLILHNLTNQSVTQPGGELLLGLPTLLTTHRMNAEENTSAKQPYALKQTYGVTMGLVAARLAQLLPHAAPPAGRNARADGTSHGGAAIRRRGSAAGGRRGELRPPPRPGADCRKHTRAAARCTPPVARQTPRAHLHLGFGRRHTPFPASAGGGTGSADGRLPGHPARPRRRVPVAHPGRGLLECLAQHREARGMPAPAPHRLAAGAHPGLLYVGGPLAASSPATHRRRLQQEAGTGMAQPPRTGVEPRPGGASTSRVAGRRHQGHGRPGPPRGPNHARPPGGYPGRGPTGTAEPTVGGLHVQPGGRAHRRLRPRAPAGARSLGPRGGLYPHDRQGATGGRTPRPPAPGPAEGQRPGGEAGGVAGSGAPRRPRAPAGGPDHSVPLATSLPRPAMEGQTRPPNRLHALASVAAGRRAARCRPESRARARDTSPRCGSPGRRVGATHGSTGQPALRTGDRGRHPQVGAAPPGARGHGTNEMPPVCRQVLHKRGSAGTPGVARSARCSPGGRQGGGLQHPTREGTEVPMAHLVRPAPPAPGGRPRRRR